jgi:hypothetical protein
MKVMHTWSKAIADNKLNYKGQELLYTQLTGSNSITGGPRKLFPTRKSTWEGLTVSLVVDDWPEVRSFIDPLGVEL